MEEIPFQKKVFPEFMKNFWEEPRRKSDYLLSCWDLDEKIDCTL